jgi:hypothetical protein
MKIRLELHVKGFSGGYAMYDVEIDDWIIAEVTAKGGQDRLRSFITSELRFNIDGLVQKSIEMGAIDQVSNTPLAK